MGLLNWMAMRRSHSFSECPSVSKPCSLVALRRAKSAEIGNDLLAAGLGRSGMDDPARAVPAPLVVLRFPKAAEIPEVHRHSVQITVEIDANGISHVQAHNT